MDPFVGASPQSSSPFAPPPSNEGRHELDYIPFAKTSKTFVRRPGNTATVSVGLWNSITNDDASVPGLTNVHPQGNDNFVLVPEEDNEGYGEDREAFYGYGVGGATDFFLSSPLDVAEFEAPAKTTMHPILQSDSRPQRQHPLQHQTAEVLLEMPPPKLVNRRKRKFKGSSSLNEKYSHMKYEMELLSRDSISQTRSSPYSNKSQFHGVDPYFCTGARNEDVIPDGMRVYSNWTPTMLPLDTAYDPGQEYWRQNLGDGSSFISTTTRCSNNVLSGGPYSTPYFRISSSSTTGHALRRSPLSVSGSLPPSHSSLSLHESVATNVESIVSGDDSHPEASPDEYQFDEDFGLEELATDKSSTDTPIVHPNDPLIDSSILNQRPLTLRDRIHKLGQEMRASAATSFSKFPSPTPFQPQGSSSVCTSSSQALDSILAQSSNLRKCVEFEEKSKGMGQEEKALAEASAEEDARNNLRIERLVLQQQRQQRRFQRSVKSGASWTRPSKRLEVLD